MLLPCRAISLPGCKIQGSLLFLLVLLVFVTILSGRLAVASELSEIKGSKGSVIYVQAYAEFNEPWAMTFLPSGEMLVTEKPGTLYLVSKDGMSKTAVSGVPKVAYGGQGGLGDIILHPEFAENNIVYISYAEKGRFGRRGAVVARSELVVDGASPQLENLQVIWRQKPKVKGRGHYSHRMAFSPDEKLFITSGERQKQTPAQDWKQDLGKIIRVNPDGSIPDDNPYQDKGALAKSFWSIGHRNLLGIAFDADGRLWTHEMGPKHGDEFNLIVKGDNYGWPLVSWGNQYSGIDIPDHDTRPDLNGPEVYWVLSIAPSGLIIYSGNEFPNWTGNAFIGGLVSKALIRVEITGETAEEVERFDMGKRIREVELGPDGAIWLLEDKAGGRLLRLTRSQ